MKFRQTDPAPIQPPSPVQLVKRLPNREGPRLPSQRKVRRERRRPIRSPMSGRVRSCRSSRRRQGCGRSPFSRGSAAPSQLGAGLRRTLERRIRAWRAIHGPDQEDRLSPGPRTGRIGLSDFAEIGDLASPSPARRSTTSLPLPPGLFRLRACHVILGGESYVALAEGLQNALSALGGAPLEHRSDSLSAASAISARIPKTI